MGDCQRTSLAAAVRGAVGAAALLLLACPMVAAQSDAHDEAPAPVTTDPMTQLISDYEAFAVEADAWQAARAEGRPARSWGDVTPATEKREAARAQALLTRLAEIDTERVIDVAIVRHLLYARLIDHRHDAARIPFTGDSGFHSAPVFAAARLRIKTIDDGEAWIARLNDLPRYFAEHIFNMRRGVTTGWTAHGDPLATTIRQIREQISDQPENSNLYAPLRDLPESWPAADRERLRRDGLEASARAIAAYRDLLGFLETEYAPYARPDPGLASLPGGRRAYADYVAHHTAGAGYSAQEIHLLGQQEVQRIRKQMLEIIEETGFEGSFDAFVEFLRTDPRFYARSAEDLMEKASRLSKRLDALLPLYFNTLPRLPYGVSPVPAAIAPGYTTGRYAQGNARTGQAGTYLVNTFRLDQRPLYELPALTAHEAVPGHHLQIALAQEMRYQPDFRRNFYATAFGEGWGLYAERLVGEAGFYQTPYERFGALSYEMWRACRLIADTGLHWYGWSREQAEACFIENTALSALNIETEMTRYIGWPGQAVAYKVGELKILQLRSEAEAALGEAFDIRAFHDHLLSEGSMPLSVLEGRMRRWIEDQSTRAGQTDLPPLASP